MGEELSQDKRIASLTTPLGKDKLVLTTFDGTEGLSQLFEFCIDALSKDDNINFDKALGRSCCVCMKLGEGPNRADWFLLPDEKSFSLSRAWDQAVISGCIIRTPSFNASMINALRSHVASVSRPRYIREAWKTWKLPRL
jgi:uncharacterized protein involved in type VI secretion and phage assembly